MSTQATVIPGVPLAQGHNFPSLRVWCFPVGSLLCWDHGSALPPGSWAPSPLWGLHVHMRVCRSLPALLEPVLWLQNLNLAVMNPDHQGAH